MYKKSKQSLTPKDKTPQEPHKRSKPERLAVRAKQYSKAWRVKRLPDS
jgi:hypothetical protein